MIHTRRPTALVAIVSVLLVVPAAASAPAEDVKGSKDHPAVLRFAGSRIIRYEEKQFDEYDLLVGPLKSRDEKAPRQTLEGKVIRIIYALPKGTSALEAMRNYADSMKQGGFVEIYACAKEDCGSLDFTRAVDEPTTTDIIGDARPDTQRYLAAKLERPGKGDVFASVFTMEKSWESPTIVQVYLVELKPMATSMVKVEAKDMATGIATGGKIALYGIFFDFDKADVKPESAETLEEISKLLKNAPDLKVYVIGHTDNQGTAAYNLDLSQRRAAAVVQQLVSHHGVAAARLAPAGVGPYAPVAANTSEEGRAKNRRVELVQQ